MSLTTRRWFDDVRVGDRLPVIELDVSMRALVMYAGATWDFHRYHYDAAYVSERGIQAPFMDGQMAGALLARQLMTWGGPDAFVRRLSYRQRNMVFVGDRIVLTGEVVGKADDTGGGLALCRLDIVKTDGSVVVGDASAAVELAYAASHP